MFDKCPKCGGLLELSSELLISYPPQRNTICTKCGAKETYFVIGKDDDQIEPNADVAFRWWCNYNRRNKVDNKNEIDNFYEALRSVIKRNKSMFSSPRGLGLVQTELDHIINRLINEVKEELKEK
jgi:hypothetical protein